MRTAEMRFTFGKLGRPKYLLPFETLSRTLVHPNSIGGNHVGRWSAPAGSMREGYITQSFVIPRILELCHTQNTLFEADWIVIGRFFGIFS